MQIDTGEYQDLAAAVAELDAALRGLERRLDRRSQIDEILASAGQPKRNRRVVRRSSHLKVVR